MKIVDMVCLKVTLFWIIELNMFKVWFFFFGGGANLKSDDNV